MAFNDVSYIQTYDYNTQAVYPLVGIGSIVTADVNVGGLEDPADTRILKFKEFISTIHVTDASHAIEADKAILAEKANAFAVNINSGADDTIGYILDGVPMTSTKDIGNKSRPVYIEKGQFKECNIYKLQRNGTNIILSDGSIDSSIDIAPCFNGYATKEDVSNNKYTLTAASSSTLGGIKIGYNSNNSDRKYAVQLDNNKNAYVNVPWTVGESVIIPKTTVSLEYGSTHKILEVGSAVLNLKMPSAVSGGEADGNATYQIQRDGTKITLKGSNGGTDSSIDISSCFNDYATKTYVNNNKYTLTAATSNTLGGIKTGYNESGKNYKVQLDNSGNAYVYVPWTSTSGGGADGNATYQIQLNGTKITLKGYGDGGTDSSIDIAPCFNGYATKEDVSNNKYTLTKATSNTLGGIKIGYTSNNDNRKYAVELDNDNNAYVYVPWTSTSGGGADGNATYQIQLNGTKITLKGSNGGEDSSIDIASSFPSNYVKTDLSNGASQTMGGSLKAEDFIIESDERVKTFFQDIHVDFDKLKNIPKKYFAFNNDVNKIRIGTSAQKLNEVYPEIVNYDKDADRYAVSYATLSIVALAAIDKLHEEIQMLKDKINKLENGRS